MTAQAGAVGVATASPAGPGPRRRLRLRRGSWRARVAMAGMGLVLIFVAAAVAAPLIAPHDPVRQNIAARVKPPLWVSPERGLYLLGTDQLGRDILSRIIFGARVSLGVAAAAVALSAAIGVPLGLLAGFYGRRIDDVIMRIADIQLSFPFILLALAIVATLGPSVANVILVLAVTSWAFYARLMRGKVLSLKVADFVTAATAAGTSNVRIMVRHVLPNAVAPCLVLAAVEVARMILMESALSFLGFGIQPPTPSWGAMLSDGRIYLSTAWWLATFPGVSIMLVVLGVNLVGDWLRDVVDPRMRV